MRNITDFTGRLGNQMFQFCYLFAQTQKGVIPDFYVQDPAYFDEYRETIMRMFGDGIGNIPRTAIHVRRGDYVNNPFYVDLSLTDYYHKAIALFPESEKFAVFCSDDLDYAKNLEVFQGDRFTFVEPQDAITDMNLMASCTNQITANSSFSWWAAYLNQNPAKKIIAPSVDNWYTDGVERTKCPKEWTRI